VALRVAPAEIDFGGRWADGGEAVKELSATATGNPLDLTAKGFSAPVRVSPDRTRVTTAGVRLSVAVNPADIPSGPFDSAADLLVDRGPGKEPERFRVPVRMRVARLEEKLAREGVLLGEVAQGAAFEVALGPLREPGAEATSTPLAGPGTLQTQVADGKYSGAVPADAKEGDYAGKIQLRIPGMPEREIAVKLRVKAPQAKFSVEPAEIVLEATKAGIVEKEIRLRLTYPRPAELKVEPGDLKSKDASILSAYVSFAANETDWDGKTLPPGKDLRASVRVKVKSDHVNGEYAGKILFTVPGETGPRAQVELPVRITVNQ
jgi:hypothetical protein